MDSRRIPQLELFQAEGRPPWPGGMPRKVRELVLGRYDWPSAIENNGAVGEGRYKGRRASRCPSYSSRPGLERATADNIVPECPGHFQTHRTMLLAYVNANFVRDKVTLSCIYVPRVGGHVRGRGLLVTYPFRVTFEIVGHRSGPPRFFFFLPRFSSIEGKPVSAIRFRDDDAIFVKEEIVNSWKYGNDVEPFFFQ